jgi:predicted metalloprotease
VKIGDVLFKYDSRNIVLVLGVTKDTVKVVYLDNYNPLNIGTVFKLDKRYVTRVYYVAIRQRPHRIAVKAKQSYLADHRSSAANG